MPCRAGLAGLSSGGSQANTDALLLAAIINHAANDNLYVYARTQTADRLAGWLAAQAQLFYCAIHMPTVFCMYVLSHIVNDSVFLGMRLDIAASKHWDTHQLKGSTPA